MRSALITMAFVACAVPAFAQTADPDDDKRFTLYKVAEGFCGSTAAPARCPCACARRAVGLAPRCRTSDPHLKMRLRALRTKMPPSRRQCSVAASRCQACRRGRLRMSA